MRIIPPQAACRSARVRWHAPFSARRLPNDKSRVSRAQAAMSQGRASHSSVLSVSTSRAPAMSRGSGRSGGRRGAAPGGTCATRWRLDGSVSDCERIAGASRAAASAASRASPCSRSSSFSAEKARTTPATELRSVMAIASSPSSAARVTSSSGCEAPVRKVKLLVTQSSA